LRQHWDVVCKELRIRASPVFLGAKASSLCNTDPFRFIGIPLSSNGGALFSRQSQEKAGNSQRMRLQALGKLESDPGFRFCSPRGIGDFDDTACFVLRGFAFPRYGELSSVGGVRYLGHFPQCKMRA
jgi:hypothetical protein